jgi:hypothetical protein|uniref:Uncharacterized protein n=1 Tax=Siphoviridae sp. cttma3 TaxID=2825708 RepID=A0A8S5V8Y5_9CAUD|nr:MAG TPA: hypothetical protein [Siphoviridae sp. cttma3]
MEAIGLNPIRLDAIGIDPIRLNAIRLGVPGASSGSVRPYIAPEVLASLVAVVKCDGKSNNDPDRAIIKNLVDPDNPFVISNAAYKLNSGFGKYEEDFTNWKSASNINISSDVTKISTISTNFSCQYNYSSIGRDVPSFKVKISNFTEGTIRYYYREEDGNEKHINFGPITVANSNGIIELPKSYNTVENGIGYRGGFIGIQNTNIGLTIEQIPSFQGALVTDGVDDLIVSQKTVQEMLGGSNEITVVSMIHHITGTDVSSFNSVRNFTGVTGRNRLNINNNPINKTGIYGWSRSNLNTVQATTMINNVLGDNKDYQTINNDILSNDSLYSVEGYNAENGAQEVSQVAWYWTFIANRVLTTDEINQVIAYYNLDKYVKPDIYYDVKKQGLSNNTPDADWYLKDFSGNGHDMQLYNYGKIPESGINEEGALVFDGVEDYGQFVGDLGLKDYTVAVDRAYPSLKGNGVPVISNINAVTATPFLFEFADNTGVVRPYSFGATTVPSPMELNRKISYQSTYIYDGTAINKGLHGNTGDGLTIGRFGIDTQYANIALWSLLLFPYTLSEFLLERQLKRYKLGTLYPDMVEFRPIIKSNVDIDKYLFINKTTNKQLNIGDYFAITDTIEIQIYLTDRERQEITNFTVNGKEFTPAFTDTSIRYLYNIENFGEATGKKSPQKIDITIDEYIRYEDIVQPYPFIFPIVDANNKVYSWGDKIKVGTEIKFAYGSSLLPQLYELRGEVMFNGNAFDESSRHIIGKTNIFTLTEAPKYLKDNEPNCILAPQILRIPNASYKILGYIPDLTGKGNHGKINNSAYAGMSGANGYSEDFTIWLKSSGVKVYNDKIEVNASTEMWLLRQYTTSSSKFKVNIVGIPNNGTLKYGTISEPHQLHNGINELDAFSFDTLTDVGFFKSGAGANDWIGLIIQQIGEYEGSFCLDGVEDFITIPTLASGAKQVLMKVNTQNMNGVLYDQRKVATSPWYFAVYNEGGPNVIAYNSRNTNGKTYIDGVLNANITCQQLLNITHNLTVTNNGANEQNTQSPVIGASRSAAANFSKMALFTFMSFDEISSEDEIKELNDIVGIEGGYVESPDYYWDAYGKNNLAALDIDYQDLFQSGNANKMLIDKSKAGLAALELYHNSGNNSELINRRLVANNFAYNGESGYSEIADTWLFNQWIVYNNMYIEREQINNTTIRITKSNIASVDSFYARTNINKKAYYKITGLQQGQAIQFGFTDNVIYTAESDGVHEVDWSLSESRIYQELGCTFVGDCNITIEQVAQYQNGLVSDGVEDYLNNTVIPAFTDFTVIAKRVWMNKDEPLNECFIHKGVVNTPISQSAFMLEYEITDDTYYRSASFGGYINVERVNRPESITYQTTKSYNGTPIIKGSGIDTQGLVIGAVTNNYWKGVFYKMMLYSKTIDMLSINMLKNLFAKDELIDVNNPIFKKDEL